MLISNLARMVVSLSDNLTIVGVTFTIFGVLLSIVFGYLSNLARTQRVDPSDESLAPIREQNRLLTEIRREVRKQNDWNEIQLEILVAILESLQQREN